jgi:putative Holliday junction resolvase
MTDPGRMLGLDIGDARIGVAISDEMGIIASPAGMIRRSPSFAQDLRSYIERYGVVRIIVGLPVGLSGREGPQAKEVRSFMAGIEADVPVPFEFWDERLTTSIAEKTLIGHGVKRKDRKDQVDAMAASVILQGYLDHAKWKQTSGR